MWLKKDPRVKPEGDVRYEGDVRCYAGMVGRGMARFETIAVYMMASAYRGVIYIGVTSDLLDRVARHRAGEGSQFTEHYWCKRLVWFEVHADMRVAIQREKSLKRYLRNWKVELIEKDNPNWVDLWETIRPQPLAGERRVTAEQLMRGEVVEVEPLNALPELKKDPRVRPEGDGGG